MTIHVLRTLFVHTAGTRLTLDGDAIRALHDEHPARRLPLTAIDSIAVCSGIDVSTPLIARCGQDGRTIAFLSRYGAPRAMVEGPMAGRGVLRSAQHRSQQDEEARRQMALIIVAGKIHQMTWALRQWSRDADSPLSAELRTAASEILGLADNIQESTRTMALGIEGAASRRYFDAMTHAVRRPGFAGRTRRPPQDPVNATLSFLYGMMRVGVHGGIHAAGLDPYIGYLHGDRDGQPALVLDLLEELRPPMDRLAVTLFNRGRLRDEHFITEIAGAVHLSDEGRTIVLDALHDLRSTPVAVRGAKAPIPFAALPVLQAAKLARSLRTGTDYTPLRLIVR